MICLHVWLFVSFIGKTLTKGISWRLIVMFYDRLKLQNSEAILTSNNLAFKRWWALKQSIEFCILSHCIVYVPQLRQCYHKQLSILLSVSSPRNPFSSFVDQCRTTGVCIQEGVLTNVVSSKIEVSVSSFLWTPWTLYRS